MPNWCENNLTISGPEKDIKALVNKIKNKKRKPENFRLFTPFIPLPQELRGTTSPTPIAATNVKGIKEAIKQRKLTIKYGETNWYDWQVANWGTKWEPQIYYLGPLEKGKKTSKQIISFDSAWSPPVEGIFNLSKIFPTLTFKMSYKEEGMGFKGTEKMKDGKVLMAKV